MPAAKESRLKNDYGLERLAIIAGSGSLPARLLAACDQAGIEVFVVGFDGQTDRTLYEGREYMNTRIGAAGTIIDTLKAHGIRDLAIIGAMRRPLLSELKPDIRTARFFARVALKSLGDDGLLKAMRYELEQEGFRIHGIQKFARDLLAGEGPVGRFRPDAPHWLDINKGTAVLDAIGSWDVGQAVVVQQDIIMGIEAAEGTDELIRRCGTYKRKGRGGILVKMSKPGQDQDLDLPTIGPETVRLCAQAGIEGIVIEAGRTLLIDPQEVAQLADKNRIFVHGVSRSARL